jgi:VWFA-related protein
VGRLPAHRSSLLVFWLLVFGQVCALAEPPSDRPQTTYRTTVSEVRITFSATDRSDHAIANLRRDDFAVVDKDVIVRNFRSFTRAQFTQMDTFVLIDASASLSSHYREEIAQVIDLLSRTSGIPEENVSIASFHGLGTTTLCEGNCRGVRAMEQLAKHGSVGLTPLYDALISAARSFSGKTDSQARKVLILFSDGEDTVSKNAASDAIESLLTADVQVYAISPGRRKNVFLQELASASGGRVFPLSDGSAQVADAVFSDFQASYQITYQLPSQTPGFHHVRILPTRDLKLQFRCSRGYYYSAER